MSIKRFEGTGRMSRVVKHKDTIYLCGQTCGEGDIICLLYTSDAADEIGAV